MPRSLSKVLVKPLRGLLTDGPHSALPPMSNGKDIRGVGFGQDATRSRWQLIASTRRPGRVNRGFSSEKYESRARSNRLLSHDLKSLFSSPSSVKVRFRISGALDIVCLEVFYMHYGSVHYKGAGGIHDTLITRSAHNTIND